MHLYLHKQLDGVRWNCANQDEVLRTRHTVTAHVSDSHKGLSDIAFTSIDHSRLVKEGDLREDNFLATPG
uniref:Uncharacterized protein n=1 Tax=Quercus lobata TaxID=97700 RepID=A0A7N2KL19_QUELO